MLLLGMASFIWITVSETRRLRGPPTFMNFLWTKCLLPTTLVISFRKCTTSHSLQTLCNGPETLTEWKFEMWLTYGQTYGVGGRNTYASKKCYGLVPSNLPFRCLYLDKMNAEGIFRSWSQVYVYPTRPLISFNKVIDLLRRGRHSVVEAKEPPLPPPVPRSRRFMTPRGLRACACE